MGLLAILYLRDATFVSAVVSMLTLDIIVFVSIKKQDKIDKKNWNHRIEERKELKEKIEKHKSKQI